MGWPTGCKSRPELETIDKYPVELNQTVTDFTMVG